MPMWSRRTSTTHPPLSPSLLQNEKVPREWCGLWRVTQENIYAFEPFFAKVESPSLYTVYFLYLALVTLSQLFQIIE